MYLFWKSRSLFLERVKTNSGSIFESGMNSFLLYRNGCPTTGQIHKIVYHIALMTLVLKFTVTGFDDYGLPLRPYYHTAYRIL